jgi:flagellar basal body-associated protein FliL
MIIPLNIMLLVTIVALTLVPVFVYFYLSAKEHKTNAH